MKFTKFVMEGPQKSIGKWEMWPVRHKPDIRAMKAYKLRLKCRLDWQSIATRTNYADAACANKSAKRYALKFKKPWPLKWGQYSEGEICYTEYVDGSTWHEVAEFINCDCYRKTREKARKWARRHGKQWPPVQL